jgi:hypothetical protein
MNYINTKTQEVMTESTIKASTPNTSYPSPFVPPEIYSIVFDTPRPVFDDITQVVILDKPILTTKGHYEQQWKVTARFSEYTNDKGEVVTKVEQENAAVEAKRLASVPASIAMAQARAVLIIADHMDAVLSALANIPGVEGELARSKFEFSVTVQRNDPLTEHMQTVLGLTNLEMDDLFIRASQL